MALHLNGQPFRPDPRRLLGQGGEACVYRWRRQAVKLYHDDEPALLRRRGAKLRALLRLPLPPAVTQPEALLLDEAAQVRGFAMRLEDQATPFRRLSQRKWREGRVGNAEVLAIFRELAALLDALHAQGLVVGDLNDGNLLLCGAHPRLIDADSLHLPQHPCTVGHERFLAPELFGLDLERSAPFTPETDWYAFAVLLFSALTWVHPYGGVHPSLPTLLHRAEAAHSVLRPDVKRPAVAAPPEALPAALLRWFRGVFDEGRRGRPADPLLEATFHTCACGLELGGPICPACRHVVNIHVQVIQSASMRSFSEVHLAGPLLAAASQPGLCYATLRGLEVTREGGIVAGPWTPDSELHLAGAITWVVAGDRAQAWAQGRLVATHAVDTRSDGPAFAAAPGVAVTLRGDHLVELHSGLRLGSALAGQTRLFCSPELGYGVYRPGKLTVHFTFNPRRPGLFTAALPPFEGRLLDLSVCFDGDRALIASLTERRGRRRAALWLINARGRLIAGREGDPEADPALVGARTLRGEVVVVAEPSGLSALRPHAGRLERARHFPDAAPLIDPEAALLPGPGGSLYTLTPREIRRISLS